MHSIGQIECPCCLSQDFKTICTITDREAAEKLASTKDEKIVSQIQETIRNGWSQNYANWNRCNNCGTGFATPYIACTPEYYNVTYYGDKFYQPWKWDYQVTYDALKSCKGKHLLEIGAGNGMFISKVINEIFKPENILCTEFSEYGKNEIIRLGVECISEDIYSLAKPSNKVRFDVICIFQVMEHLDNLSKVFETLNFIATPDCNLFIAIPNHAQRDFFDSLAIHLDIPPGHITCFTPKGMNILANQFHWQIKEHKYQPTKRKDQTLEFIHDKLKQNPNLYAFIDNFNLKIIKKLVFISLLGIVAIMQMKTIIKLNYGQKGVAQWFWLTKISNSDSNEK